MLDQRPLLSFTGALTLILGMVFMLQFGYFEYQEISFVFDDLFLPYSVNYVLALGITTLLYVWRIKHASNLGFIFMGSSFLKFTVFFLVFNPMYKADGDVSRLEFGLFFIPYAISLILETVFLIRIMNKIKL